MFLTLFYNLFQETSYVLIFSVPLYLLCLTLWEPFQYYSPLLINIDLFIVITQQINNKNKKTNNENISLLSKIIEFQDKEKNKQNTIINKNYKLKQVQINDTIKHTLDKIT